MRAISLWLLLTLVPAASCGALSSERGTIIRVFDTLTGKMIQEVVSALRFPTCRPSNRPSIFAQLFSLPLRLASSACLATKLTRSRTRDAHERLRPMNHRSGSRLLSPSSCRLSADLSAQGRCDEGRVQQRSAAWLSTTLRLCSRARVPVALCMSSRSVRVLLHR